MAGAGDPIRPHKRADAIEPGDLVRVAVRHGLVTARVLWNRPAARTKVRRDGVVDAQLGDLAQDIGWELEPRPGEDRGQQGWDFVHPHALVAIPT